MSLEFSVVIPTFNRRDALMRCLDALARQTAGAGRFEVLVVDDGSTDGTAGALRERPFPFAFRALSVPKGGASRARNAGIAAAAGDFVAFTEDDVVPDGDWLERASARLQEGPADVLEGRTVDLETRRDLRRYDAGGVPSFIPCNLFIRRAVLAQVGGYDESFHDAGRNLYFREDADLGFRILDAGFGVRFAADVVVGHPAQFETLGNCLRHGRRYEFDALLYRKHPERYRQMIESKRLFGLPVRRPQYLLSLAYAGALLGAAAAALAGDGRAALALAGAATFGSLLYRCKYQGLRGLRLYRLGETAGFFWAPLVYLAALVRGCRRFGTMGPLRPW